MPTKEPTPSEHAVLVVSLALGLILLGLVALGVAFRISPERHELAVALWHGGLWSLGIGAAIGTIFWLFRRFSD